MAASTLTRTKGWTYPGLVLTFSLLCLVGFASSLIDKNELEKIKRTHENTMQKLNSLKAEYKSKMDGASEKLNKLLIFLDTMAGEQKTAEEGWSDGFPSIDPFLQSAKVQVEKIKAYQEKMKEDLDRQIRDIERELGTHEKVINILEKQQDEL